MPLQPIRRKTARSIAPLLTALICSQAVADSLGEGAWNGQFFETYFGQDAQISSFGQIHFNWIDPLTNDSQIVSFRHRKVLRVPNDIQQTISGKQVSCTIILETDSTIYADCAVFLDGWSGGATTLLELVSESNDELIGCDTTEREDFRESNIFSCSEGGE